MKLSYIISVLAILIVSILIGGYNIPVSYIADDELAIYETDNNEPIIISGRTLHFGFGKITKYKKAQTINYYR